MLRLCSCGFATDDDAWFHGHLFDYPAHSGRALERYLRNDLRPLRGQILGGNHRMDELLTRVGDGRVDPEEQIVIQVLGDG
jgi:hypothetical protein